MLHEESLISVSVFSGEHYYSYPKKLIFKSKVLHLASLGKQGCSKLRNGLSQDEIILCSSRDEKVETWEMSPLHCKSSATPIPHLMWLTLVDLCKTLPSFCKAKVMTHWTKVLNILLCSETQADANKPLSALPFPDLPTPRVLRWTTSSRHVLKQVERFHLQMTWLLDVSTG